MAPLSWEGVKDGGDRNGRLPTVQWQAPPSVLTSRPVFSLQTWNTQPERTLAPSMLPNTPEIPDIYEEVRAIARRALRSERLEHTLQATELVHEVYLLLLKRQDLAARGRPVLLAWAAKAVRSVLVDHARARGAQKRGGGWKRVTLSDAGTISPEPVLEVIALEKALAQLEQLDPRAAEVVTLRFFGGMTVEEIGERMGFSSRWVGNQWAFARAWLRDALAEPERPEPPAPAPAE